LKQEFQFLVLKCFIRNTLPHNHLPRMQIRIRNAGTGSGTRTPYTNATSAETLAPHPDQGGPDERTLVLLPAYTEDRRPWISLFMCRWNRFRPGKVGR
jgi:hypothetical protein